MKKANVLQIILEAIVILGSFVIGGTILMYRILDYPITKTLIGLIILCATRLQDYASHPLQPNDSLSHCDRCA